MRFYRITVHAKNAEGRATKRTHYATRDDLGVTVATRADRDSRVTRIVVEPIREVDYVRATRSD